MRVVVFYALLFVFLTLAFSSVISSLFVLPYHEYKMYFSPGVYFFYPNGTYFYYPSGPNVELEASGTISVNGTVYANNVTVQPGFYDVIVVEPSGDFYLYYVLSFVLSILLSLIVIALLHRLLIYFAERRAGG